MSGEKLLIAAKRSTLPWRPPRSRPRRRRSNSYGRRTFRSSSRMNRLAKSRLLLFRSHRSGTTTSLRRQRREVSPILEPLRSRALNSPRRSRTNGRSEKTNAEINLAEPRARRSRPRRARASRSAPTLPWQDGRFRKPGRIEGNVQALGQSGQAWRCESRIRSGCGLLLLLLWRRRRQVKVEGCFGAREGTHGRRQRMLLGLRVLQVAMRCAAHFAALLLAAVPMGAAAQEQNQAGQARCPL